MDLLTASQKIKWLRAHYDEMLPNIYAIHGFRPNGCGPDHWLVNLIKKYAPIGDKFIGLPSTAVCGDLHDYLYWLGGNAHDRLRADETLRRLMRQLCPFSWRPCKLVAWWRMRRLSGVYFKLCRTFGHECFNWRKAYR